MKKRILKMISVFTTLLLLCSALSLFAYAQEETPAIELLHLREYSLDALREVSPDDLHAYLEAYRKEHNMEPTDNPKAKWGSSGLLDGNNAKTHEHIAFYAMLTMLYENNHLYSDFQIMLDDITAVSMYAGDPDMWENDVGTFSGHFYDPDTEMNYLDEIEPTAKTRAFEHYYQAVLEEKMCSHENALKQIGYALHYLQDACEPHHAANITAFSDTILPWTSAHSVFEGYVDDNLIDFIYEEPFGTEFYQDIRYDGVGDYVHESAATMKPFIGWVNNTDDQSQWYFTASFGVAYATSRSAGLLYRFAKDTYTMIP